MIDNLNVEIPKGLGKSATKWAGMGIAGLAALVLVSSSYFQVEDGKYAVYQNTLTGAKSIVHGPSTSIKLPGFSLVSMYKNSTTLDFDDAAMSGDGKQLASSINPSIGVRFADTYTGKIPMSARLDLPISNDEALLKIHSSFRSYPNLVDKLMEKTLKDVVVNAAIQYTGEEFFQGALNEFKSSLNDQANNGIIQTERIKVEDTTMNTSSSGIDGDSKTLTKNKVMVWKTIPKKDKNNKLIRAKNPFVQYQITVSQINIGSPIPEKRLETLLGKKKELVAKKIEITQRQENAKAEAETAVLEGETSRKRDEQIQLLNAQKEIVAQKKEVKLAKLRAEKEKIIANKQATLAKIEKQKQLDIAKANEGIEKANYASAKYQAQAEKELGLAKVAILSARYKALNNNKEIVMAEIQRDMVTSMTTNMKDFKVVMPTYNVNGNSSNGNMNSLQVVMDTLGIKSLQEISKNTKKK